MKMKHKILITTYIASVLLALVLILLPPTVYRLHPTYAAGGVCSVPTDTTPAVATGLLSTPDLSRSLLTSSGACVINPRAAFAPYKIPTYEDLKSLYYTQSKSSAKKAPIIAIEATEADIPLTNESVYNLTGNLTLNNNISGGQNGVILVDGNLLIKPSNKKLTTTPNVGLVFIIKGNVNIDQEVDQIDAVIISTGTICTAYNIDGATCLDGNTQTPKLLINGSLISLTDTAPIKFRRKLADNSDPAEKIVHQPKYLVILRNLMSDTYQKWSEIP